MHWMILPLRRYADLRGRARRIEFWMFALFLMLGFVVTVWLDISLGTGGQSVTVIDSGPGLWSRSTVERGGWLTALFALMTIVPLFAVAVRRLHDVGWRGWWLLLSFVPLIGGLALLILFLTDSQRGANRFGIDPKETVAAAPPLG